jgi:hypothetical protein
MLLFPLVYVSSLFELHFFCTPNPAFLKLAQSSGVGRWSLLMVPVLLQIASVYPESLLNSSLTEVLS